MGRICLNRKVITGLAVVVLGILSAAPNRALAILPLLLMAACSLSMLLMMRGMHGDQGAPRPNQANQPAHRPLRRDEQLAALQARLVSLQVQSVTLAQQIAQLGAADESAARYAEVDSRDVKAARDLSQSTLG